MCGEQGNAWVCDNALVGSPPRVRGTALFKLPGKRDNRITPACAGNRSSFTVKFSGQGDHPRVCGEQNVLLAAS